MGTSLFGTTPQDTYDSLIKVTDNGPLGASLKTLTDGNGNDSALALSTGAASVTGTLAVSGDVSIADKIIHTGDTNTAIRFPAADTITFETSGAEAARITDTGNVGIGTSAPAQKLDVAGRVNAAGSDFHAFSVASGTAQVRFERTGSSAGINYIGADSDGLHMMDSAFAKKATFTANGLTFNGDTAAANALDDYEEGTFTPTFAPASGAYDTLTYGTTNGKYTKIGNRVDFSLRVTITAYSAGSASGLLRLGNLPFNCVASYVGSVSMSLVDDFAANRYPIKGFVNDTTNYILLRYMTAFNTNEAYVAATDITASSTIRISGTYFTA